MAKGVAQLRDALTFYGVMVTIPHNSLELWGIDIFIIRNIMMCRTLLFRLRRLYSKVGVRRKPKGPGRPR